MTRVFCGRINFWSMFQRGYLKSSFQNKFQLAEGEIAYKSKTFKLWERIRVFRALIILAFIDYISIHFWTYWQVITSVFAIHCSTISSVCENLWIRFRPDIQGMNWDNLRFRFWKAVVRICDLKRLRYLLNSMNQECPIVVASWANLNGISSYDILFSALAFNAKRVYKYVV